MTQQDQLKLSLFEKLGSWQAVEDELRLIRLREFLSALTKPERERFVWARNPKYKNA